MKHFEAAAFRAARKLLNIAMVTALSLTAGLAAGAGLDYPNKPVRVLVGYAPGGTPDTIARILSEKLQGVLHQAFVVDNHAGAGGTLAANLASKSPADGYTLLVADVGELCIAPYLFKTLGYDTLKDLAPISLAGITPMFIVASAKTTNIQSIQDLIAQAKARPGMIDYGSAGIGSVHQIAMESFARSAGISVRHVPYKGSGQSVPALVAGDVPVLMTALPAVGGFVASGQVRLLASTSEKRFSETPNVPAISELFPGYAFPSEVGLLAPAGTPPDIVAKLSAAVAQVLNTQESRDRFTKFGSEPAWNTPAEYAEVLKRNLSKYGDAVRSAGIEAN
jgi:tripartite-type tricarboxylate transporter receptor subunit TctC